MTSAADANEMVQNLVVTLTSAINLYDEITQREREEEVEELRSEIDRLQKLRRAEGEADDRTTEYYKTENARASDEIERLQGEWDAALVVNERLAKENARLRQGMPTGRLVPTGVEAFEEYVQLKSVSVAAKSVVAAAYENEEDGPDKAYRELERVVDALATWYQSHPEYQS